MRNNTRWAASSLAILSAFIIGCQTSPKDERSAGRTLDDKNITSSVAKSLKTEPTYKFNDVHVNTFAGVVQLSGFVNTDAQKARAEEIARSTQGVADVANGIMLKPSNLEPTGRINDANRNYNPNANSVPDSR